MTHKIVVPFKNWHYSWISARPSGEGSSIMPAPAIIAELEKCNSWTGVVDGEPVAIAGTLEHWRGRHMAWAYLADTSGPYMRWVTREVRKALDRVTGRIELTVRKDFPAGQRWAELLGFSVETPIMVGFGPEGEDHVGYVRHN